MSDPALNLPTLVKRMPICRAVGEFKNGDQAGVIDVGLFKRLIANQKNYPRQIPVYLLPGKPNPDHPDDLDQWPADGWVENLAIDGDTLMGDVKLHGQAAIAVANDMVRGASIGTVLGKTPAGDSLGQVLEHVVLTNSPFVKGMNIAASRVKGGEPIAYHFTALSEAAMAEKTSAGETAKADPPDESLNLTEQLEAKDVLLAKANGRIKDLEAQNANLLEEVKASKEAPDLRLANQKIRQLERHNLAEKVRRLCAGMARDRQLTMDAIRDWYDHDSDEVVLAGFEGSQFKGEIKLLEYHRNSVPKNPSRAFMSGVPSDEPGALSATETETVKQAGKDPVVMAATRGAMPFKQWKAKRDAALKQKGA